MLCPKHPTFTDHFQTATNLQHSQTISNRRDNLSVTAKRVEHLQIEISVMIYKYWRKCSTPTFDNFTIPLGAEHSRRNL